jgi:hypothetical protein
VKKLKLFIWSEYSPDYRGGLAFAIAENETEAKKLVIKKQGFEPYDWGDLEVRRLDYRVARCVAGGG